MSGGRERRTEGRVRVRTKVRITDPLRDKFLGIFDLMDLSGRGFSFVSRDRFEPGTRLWCEVSDYNLCVAAEVCHSTGGWLRKLIGVRFVAAPICLD